MVYTPIFARLLRGPALVLCESEYGRREAIGASDPRIIFLHILPNLASVILVQTSLLLSAAILVEASLSFLGLGTQPPTPSLGLMLSEGRNFLLLSPWSAIFAGFAILFLSFGFNLLGDALRDTLDPRLRGAAVIVRPAGAEDIPALAATDDVLDEYTSGCGDLYGCGGADLHPARSTPGSDHWPRRPRSGSSLA